MPEEKHYRCRHCETEFVDGDAVEITFMQTRIVWGTDGVSITQYGLDVCCYFSEEDYEVDDEDNFEYQCPNCGYSSPSLDTLLEEFSYEWKFEIGQRVRVKKNYPDEQWAGEIVEISDRVYESGDLIYDAFDDGDNICWFNDNEIEAIEDDPGSALQHLTTQTTNDDDQPEPIVYETDDLDPLALITAVKAINTPLMRDGG